MFLKKRLNGRRINKGERDEKEGACGWDDGRPREGGMGLIAFLDAPVGPTARAGLKKIHHLNMGP
jgi:hypothetical protein